MTCAIKDTDFIKKELNIKHNDSVLFLGCKNSLALAAEMTNLGYKITCVDENESTLEIIKEINKTAKNRILPVDCSMKEFNTNENYDAAVSVFGSSFCIFDNEKDNIWGKDMAILGNLSEMLRPNARFLISVLNAFSLVRSLSKTDVENKIVNLWEQTCKDKNTSEQTNRYYTPAEFTRMTNRVGLKLDSVYGYNGNSLSYNELMPDDRQFIAIGHKKP